MSATTGATPGVQGHGTPGYRAVVLGMLLLVYTFNFLDRQILGILNVPIKAELGLSDTQMGALGGIAFAFLYSTLGVPLAVLADRTSRTWVVTIALTVWSGFTALCGLANGFWSLFAYRIGVGVGEAGGVAPSYAIVADYFPQHQRARALAIYSLGIPIGLASGTLLGAWIATAVNWRMAFVVVGLAGVIIAPFFRLIVKEPPRPAPNAARVRFGDVFTTLAKKPSFWLISLGAGFSSMCGYGLGFWSPAIFVRSFGFDLTTTSYFFGSILLLGGVTGVLMGGVFADRLGKSDRGAYAKLPAIAWILCVPLFAGGFLTDNVTLAWFLLLIPNGLTILWLGPVTTAIQNLVPSNMRASASACFLLITNLIGLGAGSLVMGAMSDAMTASYGTDALRYAAVAALSFYIVAAVLMLFAVRTLRRDWVE